VGKKARREAHAAKQVTKKRKLTKATLSPELEKKDGERFIET